MACILLLPSKDHKGIISFTDIEVKELIFYSNILKKGIARIKDRWIICCHINHADPAKSDYKILDLIDIYLSGKEYFKNVKNVKNLELDCSNFVSENFCKNNFMVKDRFWDIMIVCRNISFKNLEDFFDIIRLIFNKKLVRVIAIIPEKYNNINPHRNILIKKYFNNFNQKERYFFNLINPIANFPRPFDSKTLEFFYKNSKIFLHTAHNERHPRNAAYAWLSGQIVVAKKNVAINLPDNLKKGEGFYSYKNIQHGSRQVLKALENFKNYRNVKAYREVNSNLVNQIIFIKKITKLFNLKKVSKRNWFLSHLDIRLAQSFLPFSKDNNHVASYYKTSLYELLEILNDSLYSKLLTNKITQAPEFFLKKKPIINTKYPLIYKIDIIIFYLKYFVMKKIYNYLPNSLKRFYSYFK
jgi:hypothetical protein